MRRCSASCVIRETQIKTTMRRHFTPTKIAIIRKTDNNMCCVENVEELELSYAAGGNVKWYRGFGKVWQFLRSLKLKLPYDPAIPLLGGTQEI